MQSVVPIEGGREVGCGAGGREGGGMRAIAQMTLHCSRWRCAQRPARGRGGGEGKGRSREGGDEGRGEGGEGGKEVRNLLPWALTAENVTN